MIFVGDKVRYDGQIRVIEEIYKQRGKLHIGGLNGIFKVWMVETMHFIIRTPEGKRDVLGINCEFI